MIVSTSGRNKKAGKKAGKNRKGENANMGTLYIGISKIMNKIWNLLQLLCQQNSIN